MPANRTSRRGLIGGMIGLGAGAALAGAADAATPAGTTRWDAEFDVIVVGFGVAGGAAAAEAVRTGARVLVLDRASAAANESHGGTFYLGGGTALQKQLGVADSPENMAKFLTALYPPLSGDARIATYCEHSPAHYEWLVQAGLPFGGALYDDSWPTDFSAPGGLFYSGEEQSWPYRDVARPAQRGHKAADGPRLTGGKTLQRLLLAETKAGGATQLLAADARRLVQAADGRVEGVLAEVDGRLQAFRARRGVILASGGFANNRDMVAVNAPSFTDCAPIDVGANDGWGVRAAKGVGAQLRHMDAGVAYWAIYPPLTRKDAILVNANGQRFVHEDAYYGVIGTRMVRQQGGRAFLVGDLGAIGAVQEKGLGGGRGDVVAARADSIAELEKALGIPEPSLQQTLETYNRYAARRQDPLFHKNPRHVRVLKGPFVALSGAIDQAYVPFFTLGGVAINARAEVLNDQDTPIAGLYAAGKVASGITAEHYSSTGLSLGENTFFGRMAGINAAKNRG